jgi:hypothetical protein
MSLRFTLPGQPKTGMDNPTKENSLTKQDVIAAAIACKANRKICTGCQLSGTGVVIDIRAILFNTSFSPALPWACQGKDKTKEGDRKASHHYLALRNQVRTGNCLRASRSEALKQ